MNAYYYAKLAKIFPIKIQSITFIVSQKEKYKSCPYLIGINV